jgi:hypothetical protein
VYFFLHILFYRYYKKKTRYFFPKDFRRMSMHNILLIHISCNLKYLVRIVDGHHFTLPRKRTVQACQLFVTHAIIVIITYYCLLTRWPIFCLLCCFLPLYNRSRFPRLDWKMLFIFIFRRMSFPTYYYYFYYVIS